MYCIIHTCYHNVGQFKATFSVIWFPKLGRKGRVKLTKGKKRVEEKKEKKKKIRGSGPGPPPTPLGRQPVYCCCVLSWLLSIYMSILVCEVCLFFKFFEESEEAEFVCSCVSFLNRLFVCLFFFVFFSYNDQVLLLVHTYIAYRSHGPRHMYNTCTYMLHTPARNRVMKRQHDSHPYRREFYDLG